MDGAGQEPVERLLLGLCKLLWKRPEAIFTLLAPRLYFVAQ